MTAGNNRFVVPARKMLLFHTVGTANSRKKSGMPVRMGMPYFFHIFYNRKNTRRQFYSSTFIPPYFLTLRTWHEPAPKQESRASR